MFEAFDELFSFISTIVNFVTGFVEHIVFVFTQVGQGFVAAYLVAMHMPDVLKVIVTAIISFSIIINVIHLGDS